MFAIAFPWVTTSKATARDGGGCTGHHGLHMLPLLRKMWLLLWYSPPRESFSMDC